MPHKYLLKEFEEFARSAPSAEVLMQQISQRIHVHIPRYNWVGFYLINKNDPTLLSLGPYAGSFTPTPKISLNQGLCGAAATMGRTIIADNVADDARYVAASDLVKSQISTPVIVARSTLGVFNVESYFMATFKAAVERDFVENCARVVSRCFEKTLARDLVHV